ncbi:MAG TPA: NAD-dependent epimerase/dehydratase family protein [Pseudonocardiaceae bacterium]|nr:NAD-dependent epimerase/dehydratase family protein [Pseudonocardiaceae bacterium]
MDLSVRDLSLPVPDRLSTSRLRAAVIGSYGFIGAQLHAKLAMAGAAVTGFTRQDPIFGPDGRPHEKLLAADVLFYLATSVSPGTAEQRPDLVASDQELFATLVDRLAEEVRPPFVVLAGTGGYVYDPASPLPFGEESPVAPRTAYGRAKIDLERALADRAAKVPGISLRLSTVYGPGQRLRTGQGVIAHWFTAAASGRPLRLFGDPATLRDYVYIDDVVAALARVGEVGRSGAELPEVINIGSGRPTQLGELLDLVVATVPGPVEVERLPGRGFDHYDAVLDIQLAAEVVGWRPETSLPAGLAKTWWALSADEPPAPTNVEGQ